MEIKYYSDTPIIECKIPKGDVYPEAESGVNICLYQLTKEGLHPNKKLFGNVTVKDLKKSLMSATNYIDFTKFELGNDWGK